MTQLTNPSGPATEGQYRFIERLLVRIPDDETRATAAQRAQRGLTKGEASAWIDKLLTFPAPEPEGDLADVVKYLRAQRDRGRLNDFQASLLTQFEMHGTLSERQIACVMKRLPKSNALAVPLLPAGRYLVTVNGEEAFIHVWHGSRGGVQRLYPVTGAHDKGSRELRGAQEIAAAQAIATDPAAAAEAFGRRTGHCYSCGTELRKNLSRYLAMGPECMKHVMDDTTRLTKRRAARAALADAGVDPDGDYDDLGVVAA